MTTPRTVSTAIIALVIAACANGTIYTEAEIAESAANPAMGRIFFYRDAVSVFSRSKVYLNDDVVGVSIAKGFFYVDRPAGEYVVEVKTEVSRRLSFVLEPGQTRYFRFKVNTGFLLNHVYGELVDGDIGRAEIEGCRYTGDYVVK